MITEGHWCSLEVSVEALGQGQVAVEALIVLEDLGKGQGPKAKDAKEEDVQCPQDHRGSAQAVEDTGHVPGLDRLT